MVDPASTPTSTFLRGALADPAGNVSAWGRETCTAVPLDDRAFGGTVAWQRVERTGAHAGTLTILRKDVAGAFLITKPVAARRLALLATGCPACGSLIATVYPDRGPSRSANISLRRGREGPAAFALPFALDPDVRVRLQVLVLGGGRVEIDGLGIAGLVRAPQ